MLAKQWEIQYEEANTKSEVQTRVLFLI